MNIRFTSVLLALLVLGALPAPGQFLSVFDTDESAFPLVKAKMYAFDADGTQLRPSVGELRLTENGTPRTIVSVTCPPAQPPRPLSSVLVLDVSGSMASGPSGTANIDLAKAAARAWVNGLPAGENECAVTSFDHLNYLNQDFTDDRGRLLGAIDKLAPNGATDYDMGLLLPVAGGLQISRTGKYRKIIVFLTDGLPGSEPDVAAIVAEAQNQNCIIYAVTLNMSCPQSLKEVSTQTGGDWFENVTTIEEAEHIYRQILYQARSGSPCEIVWESVPCPAGYRDVELALAGTSARDAYAVPDGLAVSLEFSPASVFVRSKPVGIPFDTTITVTAANAPFTVTDITSSNPAYDINPKSFSLAQGESRELTVTVIPPDSGYTWTEFRFLTDVCDQFLYVSGGFPGVPAKDLSLNVEHPNGGETFVVESDTVITWSGIPATDWVRLEYSTDGGTTWNVVEPRTRGGRYAWRVPRTPSNRCLVRATRLEESEAGVAGLLHILRPHGDVVQSIAWSPDGTQVATASIDRSARIWDAASGSLVATLNGHTNAVLDVKWSPDGTRIATVGADGTGRIWDPATGTLLHTLTGHTNTVLWVRWSPDGALLLTAGTDGTARIWDAATGALLHTLSGHVGAVYDAKWSPDGRRVLTGGRDETARIWDAATGALLHMLSGHTDFVIAVNWSPDGTQVATACQDYTARIWNAATGAHTRTLSGHTFGVIGVEWSPDGTQIATASRDNTARIWNAATGASLRTLAGHTNWVVGVRWSPDGSLVATGSLDNTAKVWNPSNGGMLQDLAGHTDQIYLLEWSPEGSRLATAAYDETGRIWYVRRTPEQQDVSDALFSIVEPYGTAIDVDMGRVPVGSVRDSVVASFVSNPNPYVLRVDSIRINGGSASLFSLVSGVPPFEIPAGGASPVEFGFRPSTVGPRSAQVVIYTQSSVLLQTIRGEGTAPAVEVVNGLIDFGQVNLGSHRDTLQAVTIRNIGTAPLDITAVRHGGPNDADFTTLGGGGTFTLLPGDTARLDLRFLPSAPGRTGGLLLFDYNGEGSPAAVQLLGEGITTAATAALRVATGQAMPGDTVIIPILLTQGLNVENSGATSFAARLRFNATLLEPIAPTPGGTVDGEERVIDLDIPTAAGPDGVLMRLSFRAGLGNDSVTTLLLEDPTAVGGTVAMTVEAGEFRLLGICDAGGARLLNPNGETVLKLLNENPVLNGSAQVEMETVEIGRTRLTLHDLAGRKAATYIDGEVEPGRRLLRLELGNVPPGIYFLTLATPTETRTLPIRIAE